MKITGHAIKTAAPDDPQTANVAVSAALVAVDVQPVWMKSAVNKARGGATIDTIVVHHTACNVGLAVSTFLAEKGPHYMIDTDGQIVKWVQDSRSAAHAGKSRWNGVINMNSSSIGIEIAQTRYPRPTVAFCIARPPDFHLLQRRHLEHHWPQRHWNQRRWHPGPQIKATPASSFIRDRLEAKRLGMLMALGPPDQNIYGGFFQIVANGSFRSGDNDAHQRYGGATHKTVTGTPIRELQQDLTDIGYSLGTPDGHFLLQTERAVLTIQEHFFAGGRGPNPTGRVDFQTAALIKSVREAKP